MKLRKILSLLALPVCFSLNSNAQLPATMEQQLQDTLNYMQSHYAVVGVSAAVSVKGEGLWTGTAGLSEPGVPLEEDMLIGIGSNTKTFVSALVLKMEEHGLLQLDDTIGTWIQGYPNINGAITVKQVLNHTSGIFSYTESDGMWDSLINNPFKVWGKEEILQHFVEAPDFAPGTSWYYSNTNYIIAGIILESVTGRQVHELIRDSILTPLHMQHTFYPPQETPTYSFTGFWGAGGRYILPLESYSLPASAGALVSNPEDVVHFWEGLFDGSIISKQTLNTKMLQMAVNSADNKYGYGLGIFKDNYYNNSGFSHGGTWLGQINSNFIDTVNGITICVLSNQDSLSNEYTEAVVAALYKIFLNTTGIATTTIPDIAPGCFPNPAKDMLYMDNQEFKGRKTISISGMDGRIVLTQQFNTAEKVQLNISNLKPGIYFVSVTDESGRKGHQKISVVR